MNNLKIKKRIIKTLTCFKCLFLQFFSNDYIFIRASIRIKNDKLINSNFGDDLNIYLLEELTGKKVIVVPNSRLSYVLPINSFLVIGSTISFFSLKNVTIWGSGLISEDSIKNIKDKPKKILAVRGPKTRNMLLEIGIDCPKVYGDPVLLLPTLYKPKRKHDYTLGIIPHYIDLESEYVIQLLKEPGTVLINIRDYSNWKDIIDLINSCEYIVSSSLHGLIVSEVYGIPNKWVEFSNYKEGWEFKFLDFYESINKKDIKPYVFTKNIKYELLINEVKNWKQGNIDIDGLLKTCPFGKIR